jgi:hypothetical protein
MLQSSCRHLSQSFVTEKRHGGYAKVIHRKEKGKKLRKNGYKSVRDIENNGYLDAHLKKREKER